MTKQTYEDDSTVTYAYDNSGALATVTDSSSGISTTYYYDFTDRLMKYVESGTGYSHSVGYAYDDINNLTALVETINGTAHTTSYTYDDDNRVTSVTNGTVTETYTYDAYSRISGQVTKNGAATVLTKTPTYRTVNGSETGQIASYRTYGDNYDVTYSYTYDGNGNITSVSDGTNITTYVYDSANQLVRENNQAAGKTWTWTYDNAGNIVQEVETSDSGTKTTVYHYDDSNWGDLLTSYVVTSGETSTTYTLNYDGIGNPLSDGNRAYTWRNSRELATLTQNGVTWSYTYNSDGIRTQRTNGTTTYSYIYNGGTLTQMTVGTDTLYFAYGSSGPVAVTYNGTTYYYATNIQGDIIAILDSTGAAVVTYTYDAWGNILSTSGTLATTLGTANPLRYRGYVYDPETGLYYLQSRYYNPEWGRFTNADSLVSTGQGVLGNNMYAYCRNNPVRRVDVSGMLDFECNNDNENLASGERDDWANNGAKSTTDNSNANVRTYQAPRGGGGVSSSVTVGTTTVTFGHGGGHMGGNNIADIENFIANDVVNQPPSTSQVTHRCVEYNGQTLNYGYYTRSPILINVGTYFFTAEK